MQPSRDDSGAAFDLSLLDASASPARNADEGGTARSDSREAVVLSFDLENDPAQIPALIALLLNAAEPFRLFDSGTAGRVGLALHEAMVNGIHHGNLELDSALRQGDERAYQRLAERRCRMARFRRRRLHVVARFDPGAAVFIIRDDGPGFDPSQVTDPSDPTCLERPSGRGLLLIRAYMDDVSFNAKGNQITLVKRRR